MKPESRQIIHLGINFVNAPCPAISAQDSLRFQQAILANGLEFANVTSQGNRLKIARLAPTPLEITVGALSPQVGQLVVAASNPRRSLELFVQEVEAVVQAFQDTWPAPNRQLAGCDATLRELYETTYTHAFQELWEGWLGQPAGALKSFARPLRGGGLRLAFDPPPGDPDPARVDVKIESFLADAHKIFVETQFFWFQPAAPAAPFNARERLYRLNSYAEAEVRGYLTGEA